ncbi:ectonucleoside triphosphate diphosphohydrolase 1-like [Anneissia japonica]|uniref:ectonucleoside triphosphate diphosphohydrolase 1-like n=1 Tax=Anneissia japonica TaxID=1529436 RepID=UPI0014256D5F|nr:ectonucleoside triphosphate diphosphohydrolase 1-like [Anneissia japonica]
MCNDYGSYFSERNSTISDAIFWWVRKYLRNTMLEFLNDNDARIIDGSEEGVSGWIMLNYVMETLEESPKSLARYVRSLYTTVEPKTIGALDLGGASMQISFIPSQAEDIAHEDSVKKLRLYGVNYNVYSHSYLCYGDVEAKRMYIAQLIEDANFTEIIFNPCGNEGFNETVTQEDVWSPPCTNRPMDVAIPLNFTFKLVGKGNGDECRRKALNLITGDSIPCTHQSCGLNGVFQPPVYGEFMAFSSFYYTTTGIGLGETASMSELNQGALDYCQRSWEDVKNTNKEEYVKTYCFNANYIYAVLVNGYKFTEDSWNIRFVRKVNGLSVSWALGYMLNATNMIPAEAPETDTLVPSPAFIVVAVLFAVTAVIGLCLIIYHLRKRG